MSEPHKSHEPHASHSHPEPAEDPLRTPGWMPLLGLGVLMAGALWMYLYVSPGVWSTSDAGANDDASADAAAP